MGDMESISTEGEGRAKYLRFAVPVAIVLVGVALSIAGYNIVQRQEAARIQADLDRDVDAYATILQDALGDTESDIGSVAGFISARDDTNRQEFATFVRPILVSHPGTWAIAWLPRVSASERDAFESAAREEITPDYEIRDRDSAGNVVRAGARDEYFPILFSETVEQGENVNSWGVDPTNEIERGRAYMRARDTGQRSGTAPLTPVSSAYNDQYAIAAVQPIFEAGQAIDTVDERRAAIKGFIVNIFRPSTLIETALSGLSPRGLDFWVFDADADFEDQIIYYHASRTRSLTVTPEATEALRSGLYSVRELNMADRTWLVVFKPAPGFLVASIWPAVMVLVGGLLLTAMLVSYQYAILAQSARVLSLARAQTKALRSSEQNLQDAISVVTSGLVISDEAGLITQFNPHAENLFGYQASEVIGKNVSMLMTRSDRPSHDEYLSAYKDTGEAKILGIGREVWARRKNGEEFPAHLGIGEIRRPGHRSFVACITDITDQVEANREIQKTQAQLNMMADANPSLVSHVDADYRYTYVNKAYADWFGMPAEEIIGQTVRELHGEEEFQRLKPSIEAVLGGEEVSFSAMLDAVETGERWIHGRLLPERDQDGNVIGYFVFTSDVTELKQQEEKLRQSQKMESVGQLTGGVAHDFNNLLGVIQGNLSLLKDDLLDGSGNSADDPLDLVQPALDASKRGAALTDRLLAFSRKKALRPEVLEIDRVVASMEGLLIRTLGADIDIKFNRGASDWLTEADASQLENALLNMAVNARDAMPEGGKLVIETGQVSLDDGFAGSEADIAAGDHVVLSVSDTGIGMDADTLEKVFEPFFTTKDVGKGTGLGLSMVYGFAKQSGGLAEITSKPGVGTTVKIYLPRTEAREKQAVEKDRVGLLRGNGERILIVEDDEELARMTTRILQRSGYAVTVAGDGIAALDVLEANDPFDLLLADMVLPGGISGPDLVGRVEKQRPDMKILYMSGYEKTIIKHHKQTECGSILITKPFSHADLSAKVREVLGSPE